MLLAGRTLDLTFTEFALLHFLARRPGWASTRTQIVDAVKADLKLDKLTHQDLGQMQMYVNHYDRHEKLPDENPTVGLLLCKEKKDAIVKLTLPKDANIHAKEYQLYLPSKQLLEAKLREWTRAETTSR